MNLFKAFLLKALRFGSAASAKPKARQTCRNVDYNPSSLSDG